jgi:type I restriction enzyme S subunit
MQQGRSQNGLYKPKTAYEKGFEMVHITEVFAHEEISSGGMQRVELDMPREKNYLLQKGDLLFARRSLVLEGAGKCSIVGDLKEPMSFESSITTDFHVINRLTCNWDVGPEVL